MSEPQLYFHKTPEGVKYFLTPSDAISDSIRRSGFFEKDLLDLSALILAKNKTGIVLDIGANLGSFSIPLSMGFPKLQFCAFEPLAFVYDQLKKNISINKRTNIKTFNFALSNENKIDLCSRLPYDCGNIGGNSFKEDICHLRAREYNRSHRIESEIIEFKKLDDLNINNICFIKIDVEGMELDVLQGAKKTLKQNKYPPILYEAWREDWYKDESKKIISFLHSIGYNSLIFLSTPNIVAFKNKTQLTKYKIPVEQVI